MRSGAIDDSSRWMESKNASSGPVHGLARVATVSQLVTGEPGRGSAPLEFLWGCGAMGAHLRSFDWSRTPLGPPQEWPENLRVAACICLSSRYPTHLWWGPDFTLFYNDGCIPFLGPTRHPAVLGRPAREAWADAWARIGPLASHVMATGRASADVVAPVLLDKGEASLRFSVSPVFGREGGVDGLFCTCSESSEITEARALTARAAALGSEIDALREADRQKDEFLATLAHELRNPLAPISNAVRIMRLRSPSDPQLKQARDIIERQTQHLVRLVDDLLEISRIGRGHIHLQLQRVDLASAIATAVEASRSLIDAAEHTLSVVLPQHPLYVDGDPTRLSQIFANLLNNAAKYTPTRGRIELTVQADAGNVAVRVTDTGIGIKREMLGRIFDMFAQADVSLERRQGGLGIGLTVAQQLAQLHGGCIEAHSEGEQRGSTFTVHLPLVRIREQESESGTASADPAGRAKVSRRVLIADDDADSAETLRVLLQMAGHEVRTASNGLKAVEAAVQFDPDVALLDIGMPELNGYEVAARIRAQPQGRRVLLLALTGWGQDTDRQRAADAGFDHHITKPADLEMLERILAGLPA
jgi:signal transduction histidine kinase/CheY-like chemotaxis protein